MDQNPNNFKNKPNFQILVLIHIHSKIYSLGCVCFKARNYIPWNDIPRNNTTRNNIPTHVFGKNLDFLGMF